MAAQILELPEDLIKNSNGLSLDIGGTLIKCIFRECDGKNAHSARIKTISFSRDKLEEALAFLKRRAHAVTQCPVCTTHKLKPGEKLVAFSTGVGCTQHGQIIAGALNIQLNQCTEFDCFVKSFYYVSSRQKVEDILEKFNEEDCQDAVVHVDYIVRAFADMAASNVSEINMGSGSSDASVAKYLKEMHPKKIEFPCIFAQLGSGFAFFEVDKDGKFMLAGGSNRGGKSLYGLARVITGCNSYDEFVELAMKGNKFNVDTTNLDLINSNNKPADGDKSIYSQKYSSQVPSLVYCFGKLADEGREVSDYSKADLAAALLEYHILDLASTMQLIANGKKIKSIYICGSYATHPHIRKILSLELARFNLINLVTNPNVDSVVQYGFLKLGGHAGAVGSLVFSLQQQEKDFVHL